MKDIIFKIKFMVMELNNIIMEIYIKVNGNLIKNMGK